MSFGNNAEMSLHSSRATYAQVALSGTGNASAALAKHADAKTNNGADQLARTFAVLVRLLVELMDDAQSHLDVYEIDAEPTSNATCDRADIATVLKAVSCRLQVSSSSLHSHDIFPYSKPGSGCTRLWTVARRAHVTWRHVVEPMRQ